MKVFKDDKILDKYNQMYNLSESIGEDYREHYEFHVFENGDLICEMDEQVHYFYVFLKGKAKVYITSDDARVLLLRFYKPSTYFGEVELLNDTPYRSNVEAIGECLFLAYPTSYIKKYCLNRASFLKHICLDLSEKLDSSSLKSSYSILYPLKNRLASYILEYQSVNPSCDHIILTESYKEIAESLGTSYRHLNRSLNQFREMGIIQVDGKTIQILNLKALRALSKEL